MKTMTRLLIIVEDVFVIEGRGIVLVPGIIPQGEERFHSGDPVTLKRPDGSELEWCIGGLEMLCPSPRPDEVVIMLKGLSMDDVPKGTEVWSMHH
jgi:translation elongation factor EF-Tu-like GTPase